MPEPSVYRRVPPFLWDQKKNRPKAAAFLTREGEEGLSVFDTALQTPRGVLQNVIDDQRVKLTSLDEEVRERSRKFLERHGDTVEALVENGWRVVRLPVSAFTDLGFTLDGPETNGHRSVIGNREDFQTHSLTWIDAEVLATSELLHNPAP